MRSDEAIYLAARVALALLWLTAATAAARYGVARRRRDGPASTAPRLAWAATAMLVLGVALSAIDVRHNLATAVGQPIPGANWFWLLLDGLTPVFALLQLRALAQRDAAQATLEVAALTDPLTGLPNRRAFLDQAHRMIASARRPRGCALSLLLLDIDLFKTVNDRFGHGAGDLVLRALAATLRDSLRRGDLPVRWGGEEFLVVAPATDAAGEDEELQEIIRQQRVRMATVAANVG